jgi:hypothetical protein
MRLTVVVLLTVGDVPTGRDKTVYMLLTVVSIMSGF